MSLEMRWAISKGIDFIGYVVGKEKDTEVHLFYKIQNFKIHI